MKNSDSVIFFQPAMVGRCSIMVWVASCFIVGCGPGAHKPSEKDKVYEVISGLADAAGGEDAFVALFVDAGAAPRDRRTDYARFSYKAVSIDIEGSSATAEVQIIQPLDDSVISTAAWKLKKQGETWCLTEVSLNIK